MASDAERFGKQVAESILERHDTPLVIDESVPPVPFMEYLGRNAVEPEFLEHVLGVYGFEIDAPDVWEPDAETKQRVLENAVVYQNKGLEGGHVIELSIPNPDGTTRKSRFLAEEGTFEAVH